MNSNVNTARVIEKCRRALSDYAMLENCRRIAVGFSGGADSVCLLSVLFDLKDEYGYELCACHVNHGIRGEEALRDAEFCRDFCKKRGIDLTLFETDCISESEKSGESLEECARRLRYGFFKELCKDGFTKIATAHNANDNAETVLFNLSRGASLKGACGIPPVRDRIVRPLILCERSEIEAYCAEKGLSYVTDSTNLSDDYTRNKIRHGVLPVLCEINNGAVSGFTRFSRSAERDEEYLEAVSDEAYSSLFDGSFTCETEKLLSLHIAVRNRVFVNAVRDFCGKTPEFSKLEEMNTLLTQKGRMQLFGDVNAECVGGRFRIFRYSDGLPGIAEMQLEQPEFNVSFGKYTVFGQKYINCSKKVSNYVLDNIADCDKIIGSLVLRTRREGDCVTLARRNVTKTLKKLFNELNVPVEERDGIPVLCDSNGVVWTPVSGVAGRCRVDKNSTNIYLFGGEKYDG